MPDISEREAVLSLLQGYQGSTWASAPERTGWSSEGGGDDLPLCSWTGVRCGNSNEGGGGIIGSGPVTSIHLGGSGLRATIPTELAALKSLRELDLSDCDLHGSIPEQVASMPSLEKINLGGNGLDRTVPSFSSPNLRELNAQHNQLEGVLPDSLPPNVMLLDLSHNELTGTIPLAVEQLQNLAYLDLGFNHLEGSIPSRIGDLNGIKGLFLNNNDLMGTIPYSLSRDTSKLYQIFLQHNALSGTLPVGLADIPMLKELFIDDNKFTGTVPSALCKLNLNGELFEGKEKEEGRDGCNSIACPAGTVSEEGMWPCVPCPQQGFSPYIGRSKQCFHLDERMILLRLYDQTAGPKWDGGEGWNVAEVSKCQMEGVYCNSAGNVVNITLSSMGLRGTIPDELGYLRHLKHLNLSDNALTGFLPSDLRWSPLESLDVSGNSLEGFVPPMLCLTGDINGNGENGDFNCDTVACSLGTWSPTGRATHMASREAALDRTECEPCEAAKYLGSKHCPSSLSASTGGWLRMPVAAAVDGALLLSVLVAMAVVSCFCLSCALWKMRKRRDIDNSDGEEELFFVDVPALT